MSGTGIDVDFDGVLESLDAIGSVARDGITRPVAQAGAQVLYDTYRNSVPVETKPRMYKGKPVKLGGYRDSIYQVFSKDNSGAGVAEYHIAWNHKKFGFGFMVEFGHGGPHPAPAKGYLRRAYESSSQRAADTMMARLDTELDKLGL